MKVALPLILLTLSLAPAQAETPQATLIAKPGAEYSELARSWQGIPGIERTAKGRLWATWYSGDIGEGARGNYAMLATSGDDGKKWSKPMVIQGPAEASISDPLPWIDPKGRLWVFYHQGAQAMAGTFAIRADDPEAAVPNWTAPQLIAEGGRLFGKPIVRSSGGWVAPFFVHGQRPDSGGKETGTLISQDEGQSWSWLGGTTIPKDLQNFSEATLAERSDHHLWMVIRTQAGLYESTSADRGKTWSEAMAMPMFAGPATRACMRKLNSGHIMLVYHEAPKRESGKYGREKLAVWLSEDEGKTWPFKLMLDERSRVSYPDATQAADGRIFVAYDHGRYEATEKQILLSSFREEDVKAGKPVSADAKLRQVVNQTFAYGNSADLRNEEQVAKAMPPKDKLDLYLLIGQSNMAGRGILTDENKLSRQRVLKFSQRNAWTWGVEPLHTDKPERTGAGIGMSFARSMADADKSATIGLIPCAVGGTPLERWRKGGDLYAQALERARLAMKAGTLRGILWHQGENDSEDESLSRSYAERLVQMIQDLRTDLGAGEVPFVAGKLGEFLKTESKDGKPVYWKLINEQLVEVPKRVGKCAVVESTGLVHKGDVVHFDTASLRTFGERYAEAMKRLQKGKE